MNRAYEFGAYKKCSQARQPFEWLFVALIENEVRHDMLEEAFKKGNLI